MGSDASPMRPTPEAKGFQSTLPCGERHTNVPSPVFQLRISIHAPMWGATLRQRLSQKRLKNFNPRSHVGSDIQPWQFGHPYTKFQSTLPCGERLSRAYCYRLIFNFNPRSHVGSDVFSRSVRDAKSLFQSTLPYGERLFFCRPP